LLPLLIVSQVVDVYRSKLRDDLPGAEGDEIARKRIEDYANKIRPPGFVVCTAISSMGFDRDLFDRTILKSILSTLAYLRRVYQMPIWLKQQSR
jgi:hypothetical protein